MQKIYHCFVHLPQKDAVSRTTANLLGTVAGTLAWDGSHTCLRYLHYIILTRVDFHILASAVAARCTAHSVFSSAETGPLSIRPKSSQLLAKQHSLASPRSSSGHCGLCCRDVTGRHNILGIEFILKSSQGERLSCMSCSVVLTQHWPFHVQRRVGGWPPEPPSSWGDSLIICLLSRPILISACVPTNDGTRNTWPLHSSIEGTLSSLGNLFSGVMRCRCSVTPCRPTFARKKTRPVKVKQKFVCIYTDNEFSPTRSVPDSNIGRVRIPANPGAVCGLAMRQIYLRVVINYRIDIYTRRMQATAEFAFTTRTAPCRIFRNLPPRSAPLCSGHIRFSRERGRLLASS